MTMPHESKKKSVPELSEEDIEVGVLIGIGAFSNIREVKLAHDKCDEIHDPSSRNYVIKRVRNDLGKKVTPYAIKDLQNEAKILSMLSHPNIIQIYGVGEIDDGPKLFLLLDKLCVTSESKWDDWQELNKEIKSQFFWKKRRKTALWNERLVAAKDFASAMAYLHDLNILHRDLKLGNIGFGENGKFKLFDFGLATKLTQEKRIAQNQYKLTGFTGTRRYMAPEVFKCSPYGKPADVYSFCVILWEFMSLKAAFADESEETLRNNVHGEMHFRPIVKKSWPSVFQKLVHDSWSGDASVRPSFVDIQSILEHSQM